MRIAIDLDGTAFAWPEEFSQLIGCLLRGGATVVFLTAAAGELPPEQRPAEVAKRILKKLPTARYIPVVCCESADKAEWMILNGFELLIDDSEHHWGGLQLVPVKR